MEKPYQFSVISNKTKKVLYKTNLAPLLHHLQTYVETDDPNVRILTQTKTVYEDIRYKAKLRLYNYITFKRNGLKIPRYTPFKGTEIGKSIPILENS